MALLRYRLRMNPTDTLLQALARLSLANDSDRILERMVCMLPDPMKTYNTPFVLEDSLGANLWDIEPLCQIAGVGKKDEVFVDGCLAISIRWKNIPRIQYIRQDYWKKFCAQFFLRTVPIATFFGAVLIGMSRFFGNPSSDQSSNQSTDQSTSGITNIPEYIGFSLIGISVVIAVSAPWLFRVIYGDFPFQNLIDTRFF